MLKKYGNVVRVAPNEIIFVTPQAARDIYEAATKHQEDWVKTDLMEFGLKDGGFIWEQDAAKRKEVAKKLLPAFSHKAIRAKEPTVHHHIDLFVTKMKEKGHGTEGIDLTTVRSFLMPLLDSTCRSYGMLTKSDKVTTPLTDHPLVDHLVS
ncbi:hypothetical protein GGR57DRAFT_104960 [Xylariaceae sp. FL1272]|nr:hypothetical protein GGR57DRAFT_104960 [Xylariaceae sp. FL1272]